ncbi:MAG: efflux RND transporter permease subunit [Victivallaceae bacterium]|nr:efflux RND transporter permease subunit [Victivallaceae bacterium]
MMQQDKFSEPPGLIIKTVKTFLTGPLSMIFIALAVLLGIMAVFLTPREEEPQIVVPMVDVTVQFPGHSPAEVEQLVTIPLERLLWQIDGVEHVYSISRRDSAFVTVRFYVGKDRDRAMVRVRDKIEENLKLVPKGVTGWLVDPVEIDDVPIVSLTLYSPRRTPFELRRMAEEFKARLDALRDISLTEIIGGHQRQISIEPDLENLAARKISLGEIKTALERNNGVTTVGKTLSRGRVLDLVTAPGLESAEQLRKTVIGLRAGRLIRLEDVAKVSDGPEEQWNYVNIGFGPAAKSGRPAGNGTYPAVTLAFSKKKGTNAVAVAENIIDTAEKLRRKILPEDVQLVVSRNYGATANDKVNDLISSMIFAILTVVILIAVTMGWREGIVVGLAVPVSFALALFVNYLAGFTINRVTLFALILSLGLVVDDPITNVDNIQRHIRMRVLEPFQATLAAVHEVIPPVIMSTLAIIISFTPMFFITGMMGPYMGPMAINVPLTVTFSTVCALTFVPWLSLKLLHNKAGGTGLTAEGKEADVTPAWVRRLYRALISPFLNRRNAWLLLGAVVILMLGSALLMLFKVPLKMLPFDNKNELQLIVRMPEGTPLEKTYAAVQELEKYLATVNEVDNYQACVGINAPIDFNGLVRHYALHREANYADLRINLADKTRRREQSHAIALRLRKRVSEIARKFGAAVNIVEVPPGPPVLSTITVEVYGKPEQTYAELIAGAHVLEDRLRATDSFHIAEIDDMAERPHDRLEFRINRDKAALHGITPAQITEALKIALDGDCAVLVMKPYERAPLYACVQLPYRDRFDAERLGRLWLKSADGNMVQLAELGRFVRCRAEQPIFHKNLERVVFVTAECVGKPPGELILKTVWDTLRHNPLPAGIRAEWAGEGEWEITLRVFRDLGIAFGIAMIGIFLLLIIQTDSVVMPLIIMGAIPLTIIGIAPGFYLLNLFTGREIAGYADPVFFTATGMIGMIALGGIVIRNSIVLIEFIQDAVRQGKSLQQAIIESGAVRFRPIILTALTTMMGAWPITLDPIFSGLAWALILGLVASTCFTMLVIPTIYMLINSGRQENAK